MMVVALILAAGVFYVMARLEDSAESVEGDLVFSPQFMPVSGGRLEPAPAVRSEASEPGGPSLPTAADAELPAAEPDDPGPGAGAFGGEASSEAKDPTGGASALSPLPERSRPFDQFRIDRSKARSRRLEAIDEALASATLPPEERERLHAERLRLVALEERESQAEGLLIARGLSDAIVSLGDQHAEVVVPDVLTREEAGRIGELVARIGGISLDRITIVDGAPMN